MWQDRDPEFCKARDFTVNGWPEGKYADSKLAALHVRKNELHVEQGILMWGHRVVVPPQGR